MSSASELPDHDHIYRLVVAEDAYLIREGIRSALERDKDEVEVLEYCPDLDSLLRAVEEHRPNVVITDIRMPPTNTDEGIQAAATLRESHPEIGVVVISQYVSPHYALKLFEHGSAGRAYLLKERVGHRIQLLEAIREVAAGGSVVDPKVVDVLVEARMRAKNSLALPALDARARGARRRRHGSVQCCDRRVTVPHEARSRKEHQFAVREARPDGRQDHEQACSSGAAVHRRRRPGDRSRSLSVA